MNGTNVNNSRLDLRSLRILSRADQRAFLDAAAAQLWDVEVNGIDRARSRAWARRRRKRLEQVRKELLGDE
jgi:hypothetical protein